MKQLQRKAWHRWTALSLFLCLCLASTATHSAPVADDQVFSWRFSMGGSVFTDASYLGSAQRVVGLDLKLVPSASYGRFYLGALPGFYLAGSGVPPPGVGFWLLQTATCHVAIGLTAGTERRQSAASRLAGTGDIAPSDNVFLDSACGNEDFLSKATFSRDVNGQGQGSRMSLDLLWRRNSHRQLMLYTGPGLSWGDRRYNQTFFGVSPTQSARTGLPVFEARSGIHRLHLSAGLVYLWDPHWSLFGEVRISAVSGQAVNSPLVEMRARTSAVLGTFYSF